MTRNPHAGEPFDDDDSIVAAALEDVSVPALLCSLVHMTGDPSWIRGDVAATGAVSLDIQSGIPPEERDEVRRRALPAIAAYRDGGCVPHELSPELLLEMMTFLGCRPVAERCGGAVLRRPAVRRRRHRDDRVGRRDPGRRCGPTRRSS